MIHNLLPIVGSELNEFFKTRFDITEDRVILSNMVNLDGTVAIVESNKVVCTLLNIEEETTLKGASGAYYSGGSYLSGSPNLNINITVMFSAYFNGKNYVEALKFLSGIIYFFQSKPVFDSGNTPGLTSNIEKAVFDLMTLSYDEWNSIFSMMGAKHVPSVVYRVRMLTFRSDNVEDTIPTLSGLGFNE